MEKSSNNNDNDIEKRTTRVGRETPLHLQYDRMKWQGMCMRVCNPEFPEDDSKASYVRTKYETCYECGGARKDHHLCGFIDNQYVVLGYQHHTCECDTFHA